MDDRQIFVLLEQTKLLSVFVLNNVYWLLEVAF